MTNDVTKVSLVLGSGGARGLAHINVATRVMALFVAAVGIHFIMTGLRNQLPGLAS